MSHIKVIFFLKLHKKSFVIYQNQTIIIIKHIY